MAKAELIETNGAPDLAAVADILESTRAEPEAEKKKPGRPLGSGAKGKKRTPSTEPATAQQGYDDRSESIAQYAMLYTFLMQGASRAVSAKWGEGIGWTPEEIAEAAPIFGRVADKWIGANAYGDEVALVTAIVGPPILRLMMKAKASPEAMPKAPEYAPET